MNTAACERSSSAPPSGIRVTAREEDPKTFDVQTAKGRDVRTRGCGVCGVWFWLAFRGMLNRQGTGPKRAKRDWPNRSRSPFYLALRATLPAFRCAMEVCCDAHDFCKPASAEGNLDGRPLPVEGMPCPL